MRTLIRTVLTAALFLAPQATLAQSYSPKQILIKGADGMDTQKLIAVTTLKPGPMTKQDIEAALQHLADTALFSDISCTVSSDALTVTVTPSASARFVPVRFTNFVWWTPSELNTLIQARVPLYQGKLSLNGDMLNQVQAALIDLLKQKGFDAEVTPIEALDGSSLSLAITRPSILLGKIDVQGSLPAVASKLADMKAGFAAQEFDQQVLAKAIPLNTTDLYHNTGFLDATADPATFAPPRKNKDAYLIDASTTIHPGELYRIRQINFNAPPPLSPSEMAKAAAIKAGDPAGAFTLEHDADLLANAYSQLGFRDAKGAHTFSKDASTHTIDLTFTVARGELFHLAAINASALPPNIQSAIARDAKLAPGVVADQNAMRELAQVLAQAHLSPNPNVSMTLDREHRLATITVRPSLSQH
ncbi:MAG: POTRA domain-containing protein [Acidobacteriaceae bacterium]